MQHTENTFIMYALLLLGPLLLYQCTTEEGSSGSPVLKEVQGDLKVVALHRGGRNGSYSGAIDFNCGTLIEEINNRINGIPTTPR